MLYLISQILILLILAGLVGLWVGWMIRGIHFKQRIEELQNEWASRFRSNEQEKSLARNEAQQLTEKYSVMQKRLQDTAKMITVLSQQRKNAQSVIDNDIAKIKDLSGKIEVLVEKIKRRDIRLKKYEHLLKTLSKLESDHKIRLQNSSETIQQLIEQMQGKSSEIEQLKSDMASISESQNEAQSLSKDVKEKYYELQAELRDREIKLELAREQLDKQKSNSSMLEHELELIRTQVTTVPANDLSTGVHKSKQPVWLLEKPEKTADDLQAIKGIGPVMQRLLNQVGIFHFNQLARMTETDVLWVADKLKTFPKRIKNDRWQQQAVELDLDRMNNGDLPLRDRSQKANTPDIKTKPKTTTKDKKT